MAGDGPSSYTNSDHLDCNFRYRGLLGQRLRTPTKTCFLNFTLVYFVHFGRAVKTCWQIVYRSSGDVPRCVIHAASHTLCSAYSRYRASTLVDLHPPARMMAAVSNPARSNSCAAPTLSEWLENAATSSAGKPAAKIASLTMSFTFVVSSDRLMALPR